MNTKRKGSAGERELLGILLENGFVDAHRNDQRFRGGKRNPDIGCKFRGRPLHIEVKRAERLNLTSAIAQAVRDADGAAFPVVVHRTNRQPWLVTFVLTDFLKEVGDDARRAETDDDPTGFADPD